ncbi:MAG: DUF309 domain-containing protein [Halobacteriaceae archaeon]
MEPNLRAGVAIYNAGERHAAHDAWEDEWLDRESGTDGERLLHGLIQFTAAIYHGYRGNWSGLRGLAESGAGYLADLPPEYRGVNVEEVRAYLRALAADPEHVERVAPPALTHGGEALALDDLGPEATFVAADVLAEEHGYDEAVVERAVEFARADLAAGDERSPFVTFLFDFVREESHRDIVAQRLSEHVERRAAEQGDVEGLFE